MNEKLTEEEENKLDEAINLLIFSYILSLSRAALKVNISSFFYATADLNSERNQAAMEPVNVGMTQITNDAVLNTKKYEKMLREKEGSYIVNFKEKKVFSPWLKNMRLDLKEEYLEFREKAVTESYTQEQIKEELSKMKDFAKDRRARAAAFSETRVLQDEANRRAWKFGGLKYVQRGSKEDSHVCGKCASMNNQIFELENSPSLSHLGCRCFYRPYITKKGWR